MTDVCIPTDIWESQLEGVITAWLYDDGAAVAAGDVIAELMSEKVSFALEAPAAGRLRILVAPEVGIRPGQVVARIEA